MLQYHEKKIIILTGGIITALGVLLFLLIIPTIGHIADLNQEIFQIQHDLELRYEKTTNLRKSKVNLGKVKQLTSEMQKLFLAPHHELDFIVFLETQAQALHLDQNISLLGMQQIKGANLLAINTQMQVTGSYTNVLAYLLNLEHADLAIHLTNLTLTQGGPVNGTVTSQNKNDVVTLSAQATAYVNP